MLLYNGTKFETVGAFNWFRQGLRAGRQPITTAFIAAALTGLAAGGTTAQAAPKLTSIVIDANTGKTIRSNRPDDLVYPASLTKIMTLYILFDYLRGKRLDYNTTFYVTPTAAAQVPSKLGLKAGQSVKVIDLIRALVTKSANDAATVIAENIGGTEANFAKIMTMKARQIGMSRTTFKNASGLPHPEQKTTARDMAILSLQIMRDHPQYYKFFKTKYFKFRGKSYRNHNSLLFTYAGTDGIKTGYTRASGFNLAASVRRGNKHLIAVVMGGRSARRRNTYMRTLLDRSFPHAVPMRTPSPQAIQVALASAPKPKGQRPAPQPVTASVARRQSNKNQDKKIVVAMQRTLTQKMLPQHTTQQRIAATSRRRVPPPHRIAPPQPLEGPYHVQIGAFSTPEGARTRLAQVQQAASHLLRGHRARAIPVVLPDRTIYRARFTGFTRPAGKKVCRSLKTMKFDCAVMAAY